MNLDTLLNYKLLNNAIITWLGAVATVFILYFALEIVHRWVLKKVIRLTSRVASDGSAVAEAMLSSISSRLLLLMSISSGSQILELPHKGAVFFDRLGITVLVIQAGLIIIAGFSEWLKRRSTEHLGSANDNLGVMGFVVKVVVWVVLFLVALDNFGINITALLAGMGVTGIAVALATQNILGDVFASMSIVLDKPFVVGDSITVGELSGTIEKIGLKTTRIRSQGGEQLVFSNADLLGSRIKNFKRMNERRVEFTVDVPYETSREKLEKIPALLKDAVVSHEEVRFERAHLILLGPSALQYQVIYFVLSPSYNRYRDIHQITLMRLLADFAKHGIDFAYPTSVQYARVAAPKDRLEKQSASPTTV